MSGRANTSRAAASLGHHLEAFAAQRGIGQLDVERVQVARHLAQGPGTVVVAALGGHRPVVEPVERRAHRLGLD
jgi:hypothetical protein